MILALTLISLTTGFIAGAIITWGAITDKRVDAAIEEAHARDWGRG